MVAQGPTSSIPHCNPSNWAVFVAKNVSLQRSHGLWIGFCCIITPVHIKSYACMSIRSLIRKITEGQALTDTDAKRHTYRPVNKHIGFQFTKEDVHAYLSVTILPFDKPIGFKWSLVRRLHICKHELSPASPFTFFLNPHTMLSKSISQLKSSHRFLMLPKSRLYHPANNYAVHCVGLQGSIRHREVSSSPKMYLGNVPMGCKTWLGKMKFQKSPEAACGVWPWESWRGNCLPGDFAREGDPD